MYPLICQVNKITNPQNPVAVVDNHPERNSNPVISPKDSNVFKNINCQINPSIIDRKSTRLNSSHVSISYAVFCLKKKKIINKNLIVIQIQRLIYQIN